MALTVNTNIINDTDGYLLDAKNIRGGYVVVDDIGTRNKLPSATAVEGTLCYVKSEDKTYRMTADGWEEENITASDIDINNRDNTKVLRPINIDYAVKVAMTDNKGAEWTDSEKASARQRIGLGDIKGIDFHICSDTEYNEEGVPTIENPNETTFYLVPSGEDAPNVFIEWAYIDNAWERWGSTSIDLSQYYTRAEVDEKIKVDDIIINGESIIKDGIAKLSYADNYNAGLVKIGSNYGISNITQSGIPTGYIGVAMAETVDINNRTSRFKPIVPSTLEYSVKVVMCDGKSEWTDIEKASARTRMGAVSSEDVITMINDALGVIENGSY